MIILVAFKKTLHLPYLLTAINELIIDITSVASRKHVFDATIMSEINLAIVVLLLSDLISFLL